jgi:hypothetical protein
MIHHLAWIAVSLGMLGSVPALAQRFDVQDGVEVRFDGQCLIDKTTFTGNSTNGLLGSSVVNRTDYFAEVWYTVSRKVGASVYPEANIRVTRVSAEVTN